MFRYGWEITKMVDETQYYNLYFHDIPEDIMSHLMKVFTEIEQEYKQELEATRQAIEKAEWERQHLIPVKIANLGLNNCTWKVASITEKESETILADMISPDFNHKVWINDEYSENPVNSHELSHFERALFVAGVVKAGGNPYDQENLPWTMEDTTFIPDGMTPIDWGRSFYERRMLNEARWVDDQVNRRKLGRNFENFLKMSGEQEQYNLLNNLFTFSPLVFKEKNISETYK